MKKIAIVVIALFGLMAVGCGSSSSTSNNINGNWAATLTDPSNPGTTAFAFNTTFTQTSGSGVSVTNLNFTTAETCFGSAASSTGSFTLAGNFNGNVTGTFGMTILSTNPNGNTLTLSNGAVTNNQITGSWTLTGPGCNGQGTFTISKK